MTLETDFAQRAKQIRDRLRRPPNAVPDNGIDLKRKKENPKSSYLLIQPADNILSISPSPLPVQEYHKPKKTTVHGVMRAVCAHYGIGILDMKGVSRKKDLVLPRHIAMYLCMKLCRPSTVWLGTIFRRDHSTILHGNKRIHRLYHTDPEIQSIIDKLEDSIING